MTFSLLRYVSQIKPDIFEPLLEHTESMAQSPGAVSLLRNSKSTAVRGLLDEV